MIPLRDKNPSMSIPFVTIILIVINGIVFLYEVSLGSQLHGLFVQYAIIPAKYFYQANLGGVAFIERFFPLLTSQFLHGGWFHVIGNLWFLWIFGDNVEDHLGHFTFILFYLFCGVAAGLAHIYTNPSSDLPTVGASGAIAGVMGAYTVLYPKARVLTLIPIFYFIRIVELPAYVFLGIWFLMQSFSGAIALAASGAYGGVAWWAHIGGFAAGAIIVLLFFPRKKRALPMYYDY
jgi:membrane associated rhomboid family serine protease